MDITVDVRPNAARVEERYVLAPSASPISLRVLTRPCATIGNLRVEQAGSVLSVTESRAGPWITFRDTIAGGDDSLRLLVRYDVRPAGAGVVPLVHLASAVTGNGSTRTGPVKVPSFVEVAGLRATPCDEGVGAGGDDGGLVWRFCALVGIMIIWVPLYLAWARRSTEREHT